MNADRPWAVLLYDDDVNTFASVIYAVDQVYGLPPVNCLEVANDVHGRGSVMFATLSTREQAESLVVAFQMHGLNAKLQAR